jgi:hypothetical protein
VANNLLTIDMITAEAVMLFKNTNAFIQNIETQYDSSFGVSGAKIGSTLRVRLPLDYIVTDGPGLSPQNSTEQSTTLVLATQRHVDLTFTSAEQSLKVDDYSERFLMPAMNNLCGNVASTVMAASEGGVCNIVAAFNGSGAITRPGLEQVLEGRAVLAENSAPSLDRKFVLDPRTMSRLVSSLSGLLNPASDISKQYRDGSVYSAAGFTWMEDQTSIKHTNGTFSAGGAINGANQTGSTVTVTAITGTFKKGDIVSWDGLTAVNFVTKQTNGIDRQFVVTADVATGATSIPIYPAIVPGGPDYDPVSGNGAQQYQTVEASPDNGAALTLFGGASTTFRKNVQFAPQAITLVTADLEKPPNVECSRKVYDDVSMRTLRAYVPGTDSTVTRCDVLFGQLYIRPQWAVTVADSIA